MKPYQEHWLSSLGTMGLLLCLGQPILAQTDEVPMGNVVATIGENEYLGETLDVPSEGTATADFQIFGPMVILSIQAHDPLSEQMLHNVLALEISLTGDDASAMIMQASLSWWPGGMNAPFYTSEESDNGATVVIDSLSLADDEPAITGDFSALVCKKESFFAETDTSDCIPVEGTFETALRRFE